MDNVLSSRIDNLLLQKGIINKEQYDLILKEHLQSSEPIEQILLKKGILNNEQLVILKGESLGVPFANPTASEITSDVLNLVPENIAKKYNLIPFAKDANFLYVAMIDPLDLEVIGYLERSLNVKIKAFISTQDLIVKAIEKEYTKNISKEVSAALEEAGAGATKMEETLSTDASNVNEVLKSSPVAQIVSIVLEFAVKNNASDIHIEPFETSTRIRYRIDGVLQEKFPIPKAVHNALTARIKILASMPIDEHRKPLDGRFKVAFGNIKTDLRVSSLPTQYGEKMVIRLLKAQGKIFSLVELGLWGKSIETFKNALTQTTGIILVTGPTGSGKTVTQATALSMLNTIGVNIVAVEDPVEIDIPGVNQVQVNVKAGLTFASALRSILRQDPNIIMVGEVRDGETAQLAIQAALTGHLVLATLHTNSAPGAIPRLLDMGIEKFLLSSTVNCSLAQRLARKICLDCREKYEASPEVVQALKTVLGDDLFKLGIGPSPFEPAINQTPPAGMTIQDQKVYLYKGKGCDKCGGKGYRGRIGIFEVMEATESLRKLTLKGASSDELTKTAISEGMVTLVQDGYLKSLWGVTTMEEVLSEADV